MTTSSRFSASILAIVLAMPSSPATSVAKVDGEDLVTPLAQVSIDRGLAFLAAHQNEDGSFGSGSIYRRNVAVTALSAMALLSAGHLPGRGRYGSNVNRAVAFILSAAKPSGYIISPHSSSHGPMYGHGFATLLLAEVYGTTPQRREIGVALRRAVKLIVNSQNADGGWRYYPESSEADLSVTVCQVMALRAARNVGVFVPKATIDRCVAYVKRSQNPDGGFRYQLTRRAESMFPRSAAGIVALYSAGIYEGKEITAGLKYLARFTPPGADSRYKSHYYYGHYYAIQAMWHAGGPRWTQWYSGIRDELVSRQKDDGSWLDPSICTEYGTAMACLVLQMPNNYLPIFHR